MFCACMFNLALGSCCSWRWCRKLIPIDLLLLLLHVCSFVSFSSCFSSCYLGYCLVRSAHFNIFSLSFILAIDIRIHHFLDHKTKRQEDAVYLRTKKYGLASYMASTKQCKIRTIKHMAHRTVARHRGRGPNPPYTACIYGTRGIKSVVTKPLLLQWLIGESTYNKLGESNTIW